MKDTTSRISTIIPSIQDSQNQLKIIPTSTYSIRAASFTQTEEAVDTKNSSKIISDGVPSSVIPSKKRKRLLDTQSVSISKQEGREGKAGGKKEETNHSFEKINYVQEVEDMKEYRSVFVLYTDFFRKFSNDIKLSRFLSNEMSQKKVSQVVNLEESESFCADTYTFQPCLFDQQPSHNYRKTTITQSRNELQQKMKNFEKNLKQNC